MIHWCKKGGRGGAAAAEDENENHLTRLMNTYTDLKSCTQTVSINEVSTKTKLGFFFLLAFVKCSI